MPLNEQQKKNFAKAVLNDLISDIRDNATSNQAKDLLQTFLKEELSKEYSENNAQSILERYNEHKSFLQELESKQVTQNLQKEKEAQIRLVKDLFQQDLNGFVEKFREAFKVKLQKKAFISQPVKNEFIVWIALKQIAKIYIEADEYYRKCITSSENNTTLLLEEARAATDEIIAAKLSKSEKQEIKEPQKIIPNNIPTVPSPTQTILSNAQNKKVPQRGGMWGNWK